MKFSVKAGLHPAEPEKKGGVAPPLSGLLGNSVDEYLVNILVGRVGIGNRVFQHSDISEFFGDIVTLEPCQCLQASPNRIFRAIGGSLDLWANILDRYHKHRLTVFYAPRPTGCPVGSGCDP